MVNSFKNKIVLVTGSTSGIGQALTINFAKLGATVIINYRGHHSKAKETVDLIESVKGSYVLVKGDISIYEDVLNIRDSLLKKGIPRIDILVNNAGITQDKTLKNMSKQEWDSVINVNLTGVFNTTNVLLPLIPNKGRIINISSIVGIRGNFGQTNYSASKAGIIGFTKSLAKELGKNEITVNAIAPGFINTKMVSKIPKEIQDRIINTTSIPRLGTVEDISNAVLFLADKNSGFITGHVLEVTGGLNL